MTPEQWLHIKRLFDAALELDAGERATFLDETCAGDSSLRQRVEALLASHEAAPSFLKQPAAEVAAQMMANEQANSPRRQTIGPFRIVKPLGTGGMGEVYLAEDTRLGRKVALKVLPESFTRDGERVRRFKQEARAASALNHPNVATIYEIGEAEGTIYIAMEYIAGQTLGQKMNGRPLDMAEALDIAVQIADALSEAHTKGIAHRDIKPGNIMMTARGQVKVLDFGLAKVAEPERSAIESDMTTQAKTQPGVIMGTVAYMSPEQARGVAVGARTDIWSLGVVLYEMITGHAPFEGETPSDVIAAILRAEPPPLAQYVPDVSTELERIVRQCLEKDQERRTQTMRDLTIDLENLRAEVKVARRLPSSVASGFATLAATGHSQQEWFVGREPEMKKLEELLRRAVGGSGRVVFITGGPGIGKTALADTLLRQASAARPAVILGRGRCLEQYGSGEAYLPFLDAFSALLYSPVRERIAAVLRTYAPTWCLQFPAAFGSSQALEQLQRETIGATKERMLREMGDALGALAASSPAVLLLEDLHWADPSSIDLLRHLCQRIGEQRLLLIGTFRPEVVELSNHPLKTYKLEMQAHHQCEEIPLGLLGQEHLASYLDARFAPNDFPRELSALIQRKTEGHPLFATSLIQFLAERGDIAKVNEHWTLRRPLSEMELEAPESVRSMIRKKVDALNEEERRALQYASVEGEEFTSTVLAGLLGVDELVLEEQLDHLDKVHHLIETLGEEELPDGALATRYRFAHVLYQNSLYEDLVSKRRMALHRQAGEALIKHYGDQAPRIAAPLAMHFERGRDFRRAVEFLVQTGDNATKLYASREAKEHYSHALTLVEKLPTDEQTERRLTIYQRRGAANMTLSQFEQAIDDFTWLLDQARAIGARESEGAALNALANVLFFAHRLDEMAARTSEALDVAAASGNEALRAEALAFTARRHGTLGNLAEAKQMLDESIRIARACSHKPALIAGLAWRGLLHFFQSEYERAEEMLTETLNLSSERRDGFMVLFAPFFLGLTRANLGRISEALATFNEAIEMARRNGDRNQSLKIPNSIGWIHRELQDFDHALRHDQAGIDIARQHHVLEAEINSAINVGCDYTGKGEDEKALPAFRDAEAMLARDDWLRWRFNLRLQAGKAEYWLSQGNPEQAEECARRLLETATHYEVPKYMAVAHKLLADVATARNDWAAAEAALKAALDQLRDHPTPILAWKLYAALGRVRRQLGDHQSAREAFDQATDIVHMIAANVNDERLRTTFLTSATVQEVLAGSKAD